MKTNVKPRGMLAAAGLLLFLCAGLFSPAGEMREGPAGTVVLNGKPVEGALVAVSARYKRAWLINGEKFSPGAVTVKTGADGRFAFPNFRETEYSLFVLHDQGYADLPHESLKKNEPIELRPWGRVEGVFRIGSRIMPSVTVALIYTQPYETHFPTRYTAVTGVEGRFAFDRVIPGEAWIGYKKKVYFMEFDSHAYPITVLPNQTARAEIPAEGRAVTGTVAPAGGADIGPITGMGMLFRDQEEIPYPPEVTAQGRNAQNAWFDRWIRTEEGKAHFRMDRRYYFDTQPDGAFQVEGILPGTYTLVVSLFEPDALRRRSVRKLGESTLKVTIPEGGSDSPHDLGRIEVEVTPPVAAGGQIPTAEIPALDGRTLRMDRFRGSVVLVHFWSMASTLCLQELPQYRQAQARFQGNKHFVLISVNVDPDSERDALRKCIDSNQMNWLQAQVNGLEHALPQTFGVKEVPAAFLIGPQGKIIRDDAHGSELIQQISQALADNPPGK
ncbi:MAG: redoxin domain-containing protein [bacterium]